MTIKIYNFRWEHIMKYFSSILLLLLSVSVVFASNADDISKNVNSLIRSAENKYFKGKINDAATALPEVANGLLKLKSEDPAHRSIKTLQTKYNRLKARVDKKIGSNVSKTLPKAKETLGVLQTSSAVKALSHGAKNNLKKANLEMDSAEADLAGGEKHFQDEKIKRANSSIYNMKCKLEAVGEFLGRVIKSNKADPNHQDVASAFQRYKELQSKLSLFTSKVSEKEEKTKQVIAQGKKYEADLNSKWLPKITPFTDGLSNSRLQYPGSHDKQQLERQEELYNQSVKLLEDIELDVPASNQTNEIKIEVDKLRFALQVYENDKKAHNKNLLQPIESTLSNWENRFAKNRKWDEKSDLGLFVITEKKLEYQKKQIDALGNAFSDSIAKFSKRLGALEKENTSWVEKKRCWLERSRPFPKAKMQNKKIETAMLQLLENRDIKVDNLVIVDKDWWIQRGEFRYVTAAILSKDAKGIYWSNVSFRQMQTISGYSPIEIWDIKKIRTRLP